MRGCAKRGDLGEQICDRRGLFLERDFVLGRRMGRFVLIGMIDGYLSQEGKFMQEDFYCRDLQHGRICA